jgi:hypothetical protein
MLKIEPEVIEITKQDYEEDRAIKPKGGGSKGGKNVNKPLEPNPKREDDTPLSGDNTKAEIIEKILKSGEFNKYELQRKNKQQLLEML